MRMPGMSMPLPPSTISLNRVEVGVSSGAPNAAVICAAVIGGKASTTCCTVIDPLRSAGSAGAAAPVPPSAEGVTALAVVDVPVVAHHPALMDPTTMRPGSRSRAATYITTGTWRVRSLVRVGAAREGLSAPARVPSWRCGTWLGVDLSSRDLHSGGGLPGRFGGGRGRAARAEGGVGQGHAESLLAGAGPYALKAADAERPRDPRSGVTRDSHR